MSLAAGGNKLPVRRKQDDGEDGDSVGGKMHKPEASRQVVGSCLDQPMDSGSIHEVIQYGPSPLSVEDYDPTLIWSQLDDRFVQGTSSEAPYAFYHWHHIDVFNYFTHNMVTIPPAVWTNAAHKHGVLVLGTFITEWSDGAAACEAFLKDEESYRAVADKLADTTEPISCGLQTLEGLVNVENTLSEVAVKNTPLFLRYLTDQIHERVRGSLVLWYDSVIHSGHLQWQNELNYFTHNMVTIPPAVWTNAAHKHGVLVLGDRTGRWRTNCVFARGKVVGGMFETNKALEVIRKHKFSAAIFAPGWVYESLEDKADFRKNQDKFWSLLSDHLQLHPPLTPLPFVSSFCQGFGKEFYWKGKRQMKTSWFNLSAQDLQPLYYHQDLDHQGWLRSRGCPDDAWTGGCSLLLDGLIPASVTAPLSARILSLNVPLASRTLVSLVYKPSAGITVSLELKTSDANVQDVHDSADSADRVSPAPLDPSHRLVSHFSQLCGSLNPDGWSFRCSQVELGGCTLKEVRLRIERNGAPGDTPFSCRVGEVMLLDESSLQVPPDPVQGLCIYDVVWLRGAGFSPDSTSPRLHLNATLQWIYPTEHVCHFRVYWRRLRGPDPRIPPGDLVLVGRAYSNMYRVTELAVPEPPGLVELVVEPVTRVGFQLPETHWGRRSLSYTDDVTQ
ncbi:uncharacterized protein V6R79_005558 [Siganus canaliculatus]